MKPYQYGRNIGTQQGGVNPEQGLIPVQGSMKELMFPSLLFALALCSTLFALRFLDMQFYHVSILEYVVPLHHLAFVHGFAPDPGVLQLFLEVFVNFLSKIFEFAVSR